MARIAGVDIPREKRVEVALTYIFGIGLPTAQKILTQTNVNPDTRVRDLTEEQVNRLRELIDRRYKVEGDLPVRSPSTSSGSSRSARTAGCVTAATCPSAANEPRRTPGSGADRRRRSAFAGRSNPRDTESTWPNANGR